MDNANRRAAEVWPLVEQRSKLLGLAWLTDVGHKRPDTPKGVALEEAQKQAADLDGRIRKLAAPVKLTLRLVPGFGGESQRVAGHRAPRAAVAHLARTVGQEDVQHLGGADAVQDLAAECFGPAFADLGRQGFARAGAHAQAQLAAGMALASGRAIGGAAREAAKPYKRAVGANRRRLTRRHRH